MIPTKMTSGDPHQEHANGGSGCRVARQNARYVPVSEVEKCCRIEVVLGDAPDGLGRTEFFVEVRRENICDTNGPLARDEVVS